MRKSTYIVFLFVSLLVVTASGCSVFKGGQKGCGCPSKKGMVGY